MLAKHQPGLHRQIRQLALIFALALGFAAPAKALPPINRTLLSGLALKGYDPVAYYTDDKPVKGNKAFTFDWQGATWRFASAAHRELFAKNPEKYAPQYGGYCAKAVSEGNTADITPEAWKIVDGKLYLNYSLEIQKVWAANFHERITQANAQWPKLLSGSK